MLEFTILKSTVGAPPVDFCYFTGNLGYFMKSYNVYLEINIHETFQRLLDVKEIKTFQKK